LGFKTSEINDDPGFRIVSLALREKPLQTARNPAFIKVLTLFEVISLCVQDFICYSAASPKGLI
jgi:hypothetical protein